MDNTNLDNNSVDTKEVNIDAQKKQLASAEASIRNSLRSVFRLGAIIRVIREQRLYLAAGYTTGDKYFSERWELSRARVAQIVFAADIFDLLKASAAKQLPINEGQCRPLARIINSKYIDPAEKNTLVLSVWEEANKADRLTAKAVNEAVDKIIGQTVPNGDSPTPSNTDKDQPTNVTGEVNKETLFAEREKTLIDQLQEAHNKIAYLESKLAMEKKAHQRTAQAVKSGSSMPQSKLAKDLLQAGWRAMLKTHSPDFGGTEEAMAELLKLKDELGI